MLIIFNKIIIINKNISLKIFNELGLNNVYKS